jgi:hypothetical protein
MTPVLQQGLLLVYDKSWFHILLRIHSGRLASGKNPRIAAIRLDAFAGQYAGVWCPGLVD